MLLRKLFKWTFSIPKEEKEEALMYIQNLIIYCNRLAYLSLPDEENDSDTQMTGEISSDADGLDGYLMVQPSE